MTVKKEKTPTFKVFDSSSSSDIEEDQGYTDSDMDSRYDVGYDEGYEIGHSDGFDEGRDEGYENGREQGHEEGYNDGYSDGESESGRGDEIMDDYADEAHRFVTKWKPHLERMGMDHHPMLDDALNFIYRVEDKEVI